MQCFTIGKKSTLAELVTGLKRLNKSQPTCVRLGECELADDSWFLHLACLSNIRELYLPRAGSRLSRLTEAAVRRIAEHKHLKALHGCAANYLIPSLGLLCGLRELHQLDISCTRCANADLSVLDALPLRILTVNQTKVGCAVPELSKLVQLQELSVSHCPFTDGSLESLRPLTKLRVLNLSRTSVTDEGMETVGALQSIRALDLSHTAVTSAGLERLRRFEQLEELRANEHMTAAALERLSALYPLLRVLRQKK